MAGRGRTEELLAGGAAATVLPLLVVGLDMSLWLAVPLAVATYIGSLLLRSPAGQTDPDNAAPAPELPPDAAADPLIPPIPSPAHGLSPRELDVLRLMAWGRSNQEIAADLSISLRTVTTHVTNIFSKLGAASRAEAIAYAHRHRLAGSDPAQ